MHLMLTRGGLKFAADGLGCHLENIAKALFMTIPQSETYSKVALDLQNWIDGSKINFRQAEHNSMKVSPGLFSEYVRTNDEGRSELLV